MPRSWRSSPQIAPDTTGLTLNLQTTSKKHLNRPELPRNAQFIPATRLISKIRISKLPLCYRTPEPAADAQHRRRRRRHRLARTVSTGLWATSRPPRVPGWRRRLPHESPTPSGPSPGRDVSLHAPIAAPCLMLLDACDRPLDLVMGSCLLQYLTPQIMSHDAIHTHTRTHTHTHAGSILALTYTTIRNTGRTLASSVFGSRTLGTPRLKHHYIDQHIGHTQMKVGQ